MIETKKKPIGLRKKFVLIWSFIFICVFLFGIVVFQLAGQVLISEDKLYKELVHENKNRVTEIQEHLDTINLQSDWLGNHIYQEIQIFFDRTQMSDLQENTEHLTELEKKLFDLLKFTKVISPCSGMYLVLETNGAADTEEGEFLRSGLYLRELGAKGTMSDKWDTAFFRGDLEIAKEWNLKVSEQWQKDIDIRHIPGYEALSKRTKSDQVHPYWTEKLPLMNTGEEGMLFVAPIQNSAGKFLGVCGMELSEQYFARVVPSFQGVYDSMATVIAPIEDGKLKIQKGLIGDVGNMEMNTAEELQIKKGKLFYHYMGENCNYYGIHQEIDMYTADGQKLVAVTLVSSDGYAAMTKEVRMNWIIGSLLLLIAMILLTFRLSNRFVRPIEESIAVIRREGGLNGYRSGISEIDILLDYIDERQKNEIDLKQTLSGEMTELFDSFAEKANALTATERRILQYYIAGYEIAEVAEQAFISIHTVRKHNANIYQKLGINSRDELMLYIELFRRCGRLDELTN